LFYAILACIINSRGVGLKKNNNNGMIIFFAILQRYVLPACIIIFCKKATLFSAALCFLLSAWQIIGYKYRWKHTYCALQEFHARSTNPTEKDWKANRKDSIGLTILLFIMGTLLAIISFLQK